MYLLQVLFFKGFFDNGPDVFTGIFLRNGRLKNFIRKVERGPTRDGEGLV